MRNGIINLFNLIHIAMVYIAKALMVAMVAIIFLNVILRYGFDSGLGWSEEVALLLAVWFIFIAMGLGVKQNLHINISILPEKYLPTWCDRALSILKSLVVLAIGIVMLIDGWNLVGMTMRSIMPATQLPAGLLYVILPISAIVMIYDSVTDLFSIDTRDAAVDAFLAGKEPFNAIFGRNPDA